MKRRLKDGERGKVIKAVGRPDLFVKCQCRECGTWSEGRHFRCVSCEALTPWCYGSDDAYAGYCDWCANNSSRFGPPIPNPFKQVIQLNQDNKTRRYL